MIQIKIAQIKKIEDSENKIPDVSKLVINIVLNPIIGETKIKIPGVSKLVTSTPLITKIAEVEDKTVG